MNENAYIGRNIKELIKNTIGHQPDVISKIKEKFKAITGEFESASLSGIYGEKADVRINFNCGHFVDLNIKAYSAGFNQLTRTSVSKFCEKI
ncbi:hypothetical protein FACS1894132_08810 [Clostridia bacterium]|nr:hypothetical protein FACS1894132_08810 [Clostridia bacterium]